MPITGGRCAIALCRWCGDGMQSGLLVLLIVCRGGRIEGAQGDWNAASFNGCRLDALNLAAGERGWGRSA